MEEVAPKMWGLACDLCPGEPLGPKGSFSSVVSAFVAARNYPNQNKRGKFGFYLYKSTSEWYGHLEKRSSVHRKNTGRMGTRLHMVAASDRDGVIFTLSAGNCGDVPESRTLSMVDKLGDLHGDYLMVKQQFLAVILPKRLLSASLIEFGHWCSAHGA